MGLIQDFIRSRQKKKKLYEEMETESRYSDLVQERKLTVEERDLNRYMEEDRQARIKQLLKKYQKQRHNEIWHGKTCLETPNMFKNSPSMMTKNIALKDEKRVIDFK